MQAQASKSSMFVSKDNVCYGCCPETWGLRHGCENCEHAPGEAGRWSERVEAAKIKIDRIWKTVAVVVDNDKKKQAMKERKLAMKEKTQTAIRKNKNALKGVKK